MDPEIEANHRKRLEHQDQNAVEYRKALRPKGRTSAVIVCAKQGADEDDQMTPRTNRNTGLHFSTPRPPKRLKDSEGSKRRPASARRYALIVTSLVGTVALTGAFDEMTGRTGEKMRMGWRG
jgi:hypothetical protein